MLLKNILRFLYDITEQDADRIVIDAIDNGTIVDLYSIAYLKLNEELADYV